MKFSLFAPHLSLSTAFLFLIAQDGRLVAGEGRFSLDTQERIYPLTAHSSPSAKTLGGPVKRIGAGSAEFPALGNSAAFRWATVRSRRVSQAETLRYLLRARSIIVLVGPTRSTSRLRPTWRCAGCAKPSIQGCRISSCLQIARTVPSLISRRRGTLAMRPLRGFSHTLCAPPSRRKAQPCWRRWRYNSASFILRRARCSPARR